MKRISVCMVAMIMLLPCIAHATNESVVTTKGYVDSELESKQAMIPAAGASGVGIGTSVVTYTNTAGGGVIGERQLYTDASSYTAGSDADKLITGSALNGAFTSLPTTDTTKLTCANAGCTLWTISTQTAYGTSGGAVLPELPEWYECAADDDIAIGDSTIISCRFPEEYEEYEDELFGTVHIVFGKAIYIDDSGTGGCSATHPNGIAKGDIVASNALSANAIGTNCYCPKFDGTGWVYLGQSNDYYIDNLDPGVNDYCFCPSVCATEINNNPAFMLKVFGF